MTRDSLERAEAALNVNIIYQDALTRRWARELWSRVGRLAGTGGICQRAWRILDLAGPATFARAVTAAARADVLVIALRDTDEVPPILRMWAEAWLPRRGNRPGAMVALIGVRPDPTAHRGYAHRFLEAIAGKAGLDYLPRERKLPEEPLLRRKLTRVPANAWLALAV